MDTLKHNIPLAPLTTLRVGGNARFFTEITTEEELISLLDDIRKKELPLFILGEGSNILVPDKGLEGVVVKMEMDGLQFEKEDGMVVAIAEAGVHWDHLVDQVVQKGLYGLENLSLIPGTVGAAPVQNIGAYGSEVSDTILWVEGLHTDTLEKKRFSNNECGFNYRDSFFKTKEGKKWTIIRVAFALRDKGSLNTSYKDIEAYLEQNKIQPTLQSIRDAVISIRTEKLPSLEKYGTAGSFFKNPVISEEHFSTLKKTYPDIPSYKTEQGVKIPLAWILDHILHLKGHMEGNVGLYRNQPLVLITQKGATANNVLAVKDKITSQIKEVTGIDIEPEVQLL